MITHIFNYAPCPRCGWDLGHYVETKSDDPNWLHDGDVVKCGKCHNSGDVEALGSDEVALIWSQST